MTTYQNGTQQGGDAPACSAVSVTPSNTADLEFPSRALWIGTAGDVSVVMEKGGNTVVFAGIPAGRWMPLRVTRVNSTGTSAGSIVAVM